MSIARDVREKTCAPIVSDQRASPTTTRRLAWSRASRGISVPLSVYMLHNINTSLLTVSVAQKLSPHALGAGRKRHDGGACSSIDHRRHTTTSGCWTLLVIVLDALEPLLAAAVACGSAESTCCATTPCTSPSGCCSRPSFSTYAVGLTATTGHQSMILDASRATTMC